MASMTEKERQAFYVEHIDILKEITNVGDEITFDIWGKTLKGEDFIIKTIKGKVAQKFKNIFMLDDGSTYTWVQYLLGCRKDLKKHLFELNETLYELKWLDI